MKKSKIYTRTGDKGTTSLVGGIRIPKNDARLEAYGTIDELNAFLGELATCLTDTADREHICTIQCRLFTIGSYLATDQDQTALREASQLEASEVETMERLIDATEEGLPAWKGFILPGGCHAAAVCHICRTVCRRAERRILDLADTGTDIDDTLLAYINRLSDYLFVLSRKIMFLEHKEEILWRKC